MTAQVFEASLDIDAGGIDLTPYVLEASWAHQIGPARATIMLSELPSGVEQWDVLTITAGIVGRTVTQRFGGYISGWSRKHFAPIVSLDAIGYLDLCSRIKAPSDALAEYQDAQAAAGNVATTGTFDDGTNTWTTYAYPEATGSAAEYRASGVDLSDGGAGQTDAEMVTQILNLCGLLAMLGTIGGTARILGTKAIPEFCWKSGESASSTIKRLDDVSLGFRTYDAPDGTIRRSLTGPRTPSGITDIVLTEGVDILEGAYVNQQPEKVVNRVTVTGWSADGQKREVSALGTSPSLPPGVTHKTENVSSDLIERAYAADEGSGFSCEEVALWRLREDGTLWTQAPIPTWRDDVISPGDEITIEASHLGLSGSAWVVRTQASVNQAKRWRQEITVIARAIVPEEALLGTMMLPASLAVNP